MKKIFALLLTILMLISVLPAVSLATDTRKTITKIEVTLPIPSKIPSSIAEWSVYFPLTSITDMKIDLEGEITSSPTDEIINYNNGLIFWALGLSANDELIQLLGATNTSGFYKVEDVYWVEANCYLSYCIDKNLTPTYSNKNIAYVISMECIDEGFKFVVSSRTDSNYDNVTPFVAHNSNDLSKSYTISYIPAYNKRTFYPIIDFGKPDENGNLGIESVVVEDETPVEATQQRIEKYGIPEVFIGEERPEIKVLTDYDTYEYNENQYSAEAKIIIENGRTYLGLRDIAYSLGIDPMAVKWNENTKTASISKSGAKIELTEGSNEMKITYKGYIYTKEIDSPVFIRDGRTYVPFRAIFEQFGYEVNWDNETRIITCK